MPESLNERQAQAVEHIDGPLLVLAGPGSGKTRVLTHRIAHMVASGVPPGAILAITFTNKAAEEMLRRALDLLGDSVSEFERPIISTFHSYCARLLRRHIYRLPPYQADFSIYDTEDQRAAIDEVLAALALDKSSHPPAALNSRISYWKNQMVSPAEALAQSSTEQGRKTARIYDEYQKLLERRNALDFDDLLLLALRLLVDCPDVRDRERDLRRYVMIDEFQDTNRPQYLLAKLLADGRRNLCVTGDPDQSIYSWRGASPGNFKAFVEDFPEHTEVRLDENYRSTPEIIAVAARLTGSLVGERALFTRNPPGDPVEVTGLYDDRGEARKAVEIVRAWRESGMPLREIAVLYRINAQSRSIEEALLRAEIPYAVIGGLAFYQRKEVKDILAYLRAAAFPRDELALRRIINVPPRGLGPVTVEKLAEVARSHHLSMSEALFQPECLAAIAPRARGALEQLRQTLDSLRDVKGVPLHRRVMRAVEESRYLDHLQRTEPESWRDRADNLDELANAAAETEEMLGKLSGEERSLDPMALFLERVALVSDIDGWEGRDHRVSLMTLHSAKGLEFEGVILPGVEETLLPHSHSRDDADEEAEERRLFYVGITRARKRVHILHAAWRRRFRDLEPRIESRFLREIAGDGVEFKEEERAPQLGGLARGWRTPFFDDSAQIDARETDEDDGLQPGTVLDHDQLGLGTVLKVTGRGPSRRITVHFDEHGERQFVVAYTPFRVVGREE